MYTFLIYMLLPLLFQGMAGSLAIKGRLSLTLVSFLSFFSLIALTIVAIIYNFRYIIGIAFYSFLIFVILIFIIGFQLNSKENIDMNR